MTIQRMRVGWSGFVGSPGVSTLYFATGTSTDAVAAIDTVQTMYDTMRTLLPSNVRVQVENSGDELDETTGEITGVWNGGVQATVVGEGAGAYAAPTGFELQWKTAGIVAGKHVIGRTFIVPAVGGVFQSDGSLADAARNTADTAAELLPGHFGLVVWSRPFAGKAATSTRPARPARLGSAHAVTGRFIPDKAVILRSRRD